MKTTGLTQVDEVLADLLDGVRSVLGDQFFGLYLYGSLAAGDFAPGRSDIDFLVVTRDLLPETTIVKLEALHRRLAQSENEWAAKLEGVYFPLAELRSYDPQGPALPTVNEGRFFLAGQGSDWVIQRHTLREHEMIVAGASIREYIDPVSPDDLRSAVRAVLAEWWEPMLGNPSWLDKPAYRAFAVLSLCRVLATLREGSAVSKTAAAQLAMAELGEPWQTLIADALAWPNAEAPALQPALAFMGHVVELCHDL